MIDLSKDAQLSRSLGGTAAASRLVSSSGLVNARNVSGLATGAKASGSSGKYAKR